MPLPISDFGFSMIDLNSYLQSCLDDRTSPLHTEDRGDFRLAQASLQAYVEWKGGTLDSTNILDLALPGWLNDYFEYLVEEYESNKSRNQERKTQRERIQWAKRYLKCLRKVLNRAIRNGFLPNIDFLRCIDKASEFSRKQGVEEVSLAAGQLLKLSKTKITYKISAVQEECNDASIEKVANSKGNLKSKKSKISNDVADKKDAPDKKWEYELTLGAADLYLLCMYCGGLELDEFYQLLDSEIDRTQPTIHLPWAGIDIEISQTIHSALLAYRSMPQFGKRTNEVISRAIKASQASLFQSESIFIDWLRFAKDQGMSDDHIFRLIEIRYDAEATADEDLKKAIQKVVYRMGAHYNKFKKQWYCVYTHKSTGEDKYKEMLKCQPPIVPNMDQRDTDFYFPNTNEISVHSVRGQKIMDPRAVLKRYLFVCCSPYEIRTIDQNVENINVLGRRKNGIKDYTIVPATEIYTLQLMLESIRGTEAELMLEDEEIKAAMDTTPLQNKERVKILTPTYQEYEAEVIKVKPNSYYSVQLSIIGKTFVLKNVPRALIKKID